MSELLPKRFVSGKALSLPAAMILREYPDALNVPGRDDVNMKLVLRTTRIKEIKVSVVSHKEAVTPLSLFLCHCRGAVPGPIVKTPVHRKAVMLSLVLSAIGLYGICYPVRKQTGFSSATHIAVVAQNEQIKIVDKSINIAAVRI